MKGRAIFVLLLFGVASLQLRAEQTHADETRAKAEAGDASAQIALGARYASGLGAAKDEIEAAKWYRKAAEQNDPLGQFLLGGCYDDGQGVPKDKAEAMRWYRKAAEQGILPAQYDLGFAYFYGEGVVKDETEAVKWYRKAADKNYALAQLELGICYASGQGVERDETGAVTWYRKAAEQGNASAQFNLGVCYANGQGVAGDKKEAVSWYRRAAELDDVGAQFNLGFCYAHGQGVAKDEAEAVKWYRKAAEQDDADAQSNLGLCYEHGQGVAKDDVEAVSWYRKAAEQNNAQAQYNLGFCYAHGQGVAKDYMEGYKWWLLAAGQGNESAKMYITGLENEMTREQIAEGQRLAHNFKPRKEPKPDNFGSNESPTASGTGFFITEDGYLISNYHVVKDAAQVRLVTSTGLIAAKVVRVDPANDLALLKAEGNFTPLPVAASRTAHLGNTVATVGFPNIGLQGFAPKFAKGEIAALSGAGDDARYFQISVPLQPGNSGGALVDEHGNVVGVVSAKLDAATALAASGALPENVNYAIKSSFLLSFLESAPEVSAKLKEPNSKKIEFEEVVEKARQAAVLVVIY